MKNLSAVVFLGLIRMSIAASLLCGIPAQAAVSPATVAVSLSSGYPTEGGGSASSGSTSPYPETCPMLPECDELITGSYSFSGFQTKLSRPDVNGDGRVTLCLCGAQVQQASTESNPLLITQYDLAIKGIGTLPSQFSINRKYGRVFNIHQAHFISLENFTINVNGDFTMGIEIEDSDPLDLNKLTFKIIGRGNALQLWKNSRVNTFRDSSISISTQSSATAIEIWTQSEISSLTNVSVSTDGNLTNSIFMSDQSRIGELLSFTTPGKAGLDISIHNSSGIGKMDKVSIGGFQAEDRCSVGKITNSTLQGTLFLDENSVLTYLDHTSARQLFITDNSLVGSINETNLRSSSAPVFMLDSIVSVFRRCNIELTQGVGSVVFVDEHSRVNMIYGGKIKSPSATNHIYNTKRIDEIVGVTFE